jgi:hypothetical protein
MNMLKILIRGVAGLVSLICAPLAGTAFAQGNAPPPAQALAALRAEVQTRADHQAYPIAGIDPRDVRQVLAGLTGMDPEAGTPKFAWVNPNGGHTGRSKDFSEDRITSQIVVPWLVSMLGPGAHAQ